MGSEVKAAQRRAANALGQLNEAIHQHAFVVVAHDHVHPDRDVCGGVGRCLLMATELDAERAVTDLLERAAREGLSLSVAVSP